MGTLNESEITVDSARDLTKATTKLMLETMENSIFGKLKQYGCINYEEDLTRKSGSNLTMYNVLRDDGLPDVGDVDSYSTATSGDSGDRSLKIRLQSKSKHFAKDGTEAQQVSEFNLRNHIPQMMTNWMKELLLLQTINQVSSNTATTIYTPSIYSGNATTADQRLIMTGHNAATAPTSTYHLWANNDAGSITNDQGTTSSQTLRLKDFMIFREVADSVRSGQPIFNKLETTIMGRRVNYVALVGTSGLNQMKQDQQGSKNNLVLSELQFAAMAGGKDNITVGNGMYCLEDFLIIEVPDYLLARGVHNSTSAPVTTARRVAIMGRNAVDVGAGKGFSFNGNEIAGFKIAIDDDYKKLNDRGYAKVSFNGGMKKTSVYGFGGNESTLYDLASGVITYYSAN